MAIALTEFGGKQYRDQPQSRVMGLLLLLLLAGLQAAHFALLDLGWDWVGSLPYRIALFAIAPSFFLFSEPLLQPDDEAPPRFAMPKGLHFVPCALAPFVPAPWAQPLAFLVGAAYLVRLARGLLPLRAERERFSAELALLGLAFSIAIGVALLGLMPWLMSQRPFTACYASAIGLAFLLVQTSLGLRPALSAEVQEAVRSKYLNTSLAKVDCDLVLARLDALMVSERLFVDTELGLAALAARVGLSPHQLSELLNTRLGKGFARYLRELRIDAAKVMLCDEPSASVLSVGLSVGFSSQSTFYEAFREIEGTTPGQYRKLHLKPVGPR